VWLEFYTKQYGAPGFGSRLVVAQMTTTVLDTYSGPGIIFLAARLFDSTRPIPDEKLAREVAYQWWGQTVGLKSFDDAWISQGLAEWSAFAYRESMLNWRSARRGPARAAGAGAYVRTDSLNRPGRPAPWTTNPQPIQSIVFYKGSMVYRMLRETIGNDKFDRLLRGFLEQYRARMPRWMTLRSWLRRWPSKTFVTSSRSGSKVLVFPSSPLTIRLSGTRSGKFPHARHSQADS